MIALLRVLQEKGFERVGSNHPISIDVRLIAATNRNLAAAVAAGTFRQDLFYRLNVFPIEVPPLRERAEDIPLLVQYFVGRFAKGAGKNIRHIGRDTLEQLKSYSWPGNIRELQNGRREWAQSKSRDKECRFRNVADARNHQRHFVDELWTN